MFAFSLVAIDLWSQLRKARHPFHDRKHRSHFACRAPRDIQVRNQLIGRPAFETFGNVVGDGKRGSLDLICKIALAAKGGMSGPLERSRSQIGRKFPDRLLFKASVFHGVFQSQISDLKFQKNQPQSRGRGSIARSTNDFYPSILTNPHTPRFEIQDLRSEIPDP